MAVKKKTATPVSVEVRVYNVGLGDCLLLTFKSKSGTNESTHRILVDFGSTGKNKKDGPSLSQIADQIVQDCGGRDAPLDAIVVTHRHQDHMSGFGGSSGQTLIEQLRPQFIIQPWTEAPGADNPPQTGATASEVAAARHVLSMSDAQVVTDSILNEILVRREKGMGRKSDDKAIFYCQKNLPFFNGKTVAKVNASDDDLLQGLNTESIKNANAIANLQRWSWKIGRRTFKPKFKFLEKDNRLNLPIPGLKIKVLGPVGPDHWESLKKHADTEELWKKLQALRSDNGQPAKSSNVSDYIEFRAEEGAYGVPAIFKEEATVPDGDLRKDSVRWLIENLDKLRGEQLLNFVTVLDKHINNTSLVLLFEFGGFRMLFPGDAEVAAWKAIVEDDKAASELRNINLYKVGHHGSNNATPKLSLWNKMIEDRDEDHPLHCVLSTQPTKFAGSIPNQTLLNTMLRSDVFHLISTAYPDGSSESKHTDDWQIHEKGRGARKVVMSYSREFEL